MIKIKKIIDRDELKFRYIIYDTSEVFNADKGNQLKPSNDPRRPNEPPIIYFKLKNGKRSFQYLDRLIASTFCDNYTDSSYIYHKDGDVNNCRLDNIMVLTGLDILREVYKDFKIWKHINIPDIKLYYDYYVCEDGRVFNGTTGQFIVPFKDKRYGNYDNLRYSLYYGKSLKERLHYGANRLVAIHFLPTKPDNKDLVLFKDRDHSNLHYSNLFWGDEWDHLNQDILNKTTRKFTKIQNAILGKEKWKKLLIPGVQLTYRYKVSNFGRIWNCDKEFYCSRHNSSSSNPNGQSYQLINLSIDGYGYKEFPIHRLVAFAFCDNDDPDNKITINHINGNPSCNLAINLEWCTPYENLHHAIETNLYHSSLYINKVTSDNWRLNTLYAWIYSINNMNDERAFQIYRDYQKLYDDNIPEMKYDEFIKTYNDKKDNDKDFQVIFNFYKSRYGKSK